MPIKYRNCGHCKSKSTLNYYHEDDKTGCDLYYCNKCFKLTLWDAKKCELIDGEAYPNRDK